MNPKLLILNGEDAGKKILLPSDEAFIVGRDKACDIFLNERKVSRQHSRFYFDSSENKVYVEDLESLNGTFLNAERIQGRTPIHHQDQIRIGSHILQLITESLSLEESLVSLESLSHSQMTDGEKEGSFFEPEESGEKQLEDALNVFSDLDLAEKPDDATGGRILSGKLSELSLPDVLQMLATTKKSGVLSISRSKLTHLPSSSSESTAKLYLKKGSLEWVEFNAQTGQEAFFSCLEIEEGFFALFPSDRFDFEDPIEIPLEMLLLEGLSKLDERRANAQTLVEDDVLEPYPGESLSGLSGDELKIFQLAWKHKKVSSVLKFSHLDKLQTLDLLRKLIKNSLLKKIKG